MRIRTKLLIGLAIALPLAIVAAYVGSLDWRYQHSTYSSQLPVYNGNDSRTTKGTNGHFQVEAQGMTFNARLYGMENQGDALILLHGFPEMSVMWEPLATAASQAGFRVMAFDQRGYSPGARPADKENYTIDLLSSDVIAMADAVGFNRFHLVGHDWGSVVGWVVAQRFEERLQSWTAMSIPHTGLFFHSAVHEEAQRERSSYINLLRLPVIPEYFAMVAGQRNLQGFLGRLPEDHKAQYLALLREPGAMTAALNWYRALDIDRMTDNEEIMAPVSTPTLFLWGESDPVVAPSVIQQLPDYVDGPYREVPMEAGHSLIQSAPDTVIAEVLHHVRSNG